MTAFLNPLPRPGVHVLVHYAEPLLAVGLAAALRSVPGLAVTAHGIEPASAGGRPVDVVVTDYLAGMELAASQRQGGAGPLAAARVMIVAAQDRENNVRRALEAGVHGYLLLGSSLDELACGVQALARGSKYLSMEVAQRMADSLTHEALTAREADVMRLLARGDCNKTIARRLDIAIGTVKTHVKSIMAKLDAASRTQAVTIAARRGLVDALPPEAPAPSGVFRGAADFAHYA